MGQVNGAEILSNKKAIAGILLSNGQSRLSGDAAVYAELSREYGKAIVFNEADLPHAFEHPKDIPSGKRIFTPQQIRKRSLALIKICKASSPDFDVTSWAKKRLIVRTAKQCCASINSIVPERNANSSNDELRHHDVIIRIPNRNWSDKTMYAMRTRLPEDMIKDYPQGGVAHVITAGHEIGHSGESGDILDGNTVEKIWARENGADRAGIDCATVVARAPTIDPEFKAELERGIAREPLVRLIARFLDQPCYYGTGAVLKAYQEGRAAPSFAQISVAEDELRWRCYETLQYKRGQPYKLMSINDDSERVQATIRAFWRRGLEDDKLFDPIHRACNTSANAEYARDMFFVLREVLATHPITDPLTRQLGADILEGVQDFCPDFFGAPKFGEAAEQIGRHPLLQPNNDWPRIPAHIIPGQAPLKGPHVGG